MTYQRIRWSLLAEETKDSWVDNRCGMKGLLGFNHLEAELENEQPREDSNLTLWIVFKGLQFNETSQI